MLLTLTLSCTLKDDKISKYFLINLISIELLLGLFLALTSTKERSPPPLNIHQLSPFVLSYSWRNCHCLTGQSEEIQRYTKRNGSVCSATQNRNLDLTFGDVHVFLLVLSHSNRLLSVVLKTSYLLLFLTDLPPSPPHGTLYHIGLSFQHLILLSSPLITSFKILSPLRLWHF